MPLLNRAPAEQGWREFLDILRGTAERTGIPFVQVSPAGTSQDCSRRGTKVPRALSERTHRCGASGLELDRGENAAKNVVSRGLCIFPGAVATGGTVGGAPAASAARQLQEQKTRRLRSKEGSSKEQNRKNQARFLPLDYCKPRNKPIMGHTRQLFGSSWSDNARTP